MQAPIDCQSLSGLSRRFPAPEIIDVRSAAARAADPVLIPGALVRDRESLVDWSARLERWRETVVYCAEGHERSIDAASTLCALGFAARPLAGGLAAWRQAGLPTVPFRPPTRWVTRERPKIDRIACPWLVRRFIDPAAEFHFVPASDVRAFAARDGATPFDVPGAQYGHVGTACSFDAFIARHGLADSALTRLAVIVRAADTDTLDLSAEAPGLYAVSLGLSAMFEDDHAQLVASLLVYDALYVWCLQAEGRTRWNRTLPQAA